MPTIAATSSPPPTAKDWPDNEQELLAFGPTRTPENYWSLKDAFEGVQIFGATGSGKTSGSGQAIARAFMEGNLGGLVLTAKPDEILSWKAYAKAYKREPDLLIVEEGSPHRFNFLRYELQRPGRGGKHTENLVNLFYSVLEAAEKRQGVGGNDAYWQRTLKQLLRNAIDLSLIAADDVHLPSLYRIIVSAPRSFDETVDENWKGRSVCSALLELAAGQAELKGRVNDWEMTRDYWLLEFLSREKMGQPMNAFVLDRKGNIELEDFYVRGKLQSPGGEDPGAILSVVVDTIQPAKGDVRFKRA